MSRYHVSYEYLKADVSINEDMCISRQMWVSRYHVSYEYLKADVSINEDMYISRQM